MSLYRKYRPKKFSEISGQKHIAQTLSNSIKHGRIGHAYLFTGSRGIGKTTLARIFAKTINCLEPQKGKDFPVEPCDKCQNCKSIIEGKTIDLIEIDAASHTGVDNIRQLKENINLPPSFLRKKVYIIDEVHMLSTGAFNALLKTLEEPPEHSVFILATTELHKVPETIISRCQRFDFHRFDQNQIIERLEKLAKKEKVEVEKEALESIALEAEGGMRDAESLLGQIISLEDKKITSKEVNQILGISSRKKVFDFVKKTLAGKTEEALKIIENIQDDGYDIKNFNKNVLSILRILMIGKINSAAGKKEAAMTEEDYKKLDKVIEKIPTSKILFTVDVFQKSLSKSKEVPIPQLPLEMAVLEMHLKFNSSDEENIKEKPEEQLQKPADSEKKSFNSPAFSSKNSQKQEKPPKSQSEKPLKKEDSPNSSGDQNAGEKEAGKTFSKQDSNKKKVLQKNTKGNNSKEQTCDNNQLLNLVLENWSQIVEAVKPANHSIHACLKNCIPLGVKQEEFYIKTKYSFYKDRLSEAKNKLTISKAIAKIIGYDVKVKIVSEEEARDLNFEDSQSDQEKDRNVLHEAMRMMGGKIIE
ncbi:MAG: DNA polymerase III subunit gamma/tau [Patescibacteria group bacterium]